MIEQCRKSESCILGVHSGGCMSADEQEALSNRYVDAIRVVPLSSGRFALFKLAGGIRPLVVETLRDEEIREMHKQQREEYEAGKARIIVRPREPTPRPQAGKVTINLDELFS